MENDSGLERVRPNTQSRRDRSIALFPKIGRTETSCRGELMERNVFVCLPTIVIIDRKQLGERRTMHCMHILCIQSARMH